MCVSRFYKFILFVVFLSTGKLYAQFNQFSTGNVVQVSHAGDCFPVVITEDREIYEVVQSDMPLTLGDNITFAKALTQTTSSCLLNTQIVIYVTSVNSSNNSSNLCDYVDCVTPGDVNQDGLVDMVDMVMVHQNGGASGMFRPNATTYFDYQFSQDWEEETYLGNNLKHLDADGNGIILNEDLDVVAKNYNLHLEIEEINYPVLEGYTVNIEFVEDELSIPDAYSGGNIHSSALIRFNGSGEELKNVSAITFEIEHSNEDFIKTEDLSFVQEDPDFFVPEDEVPNLIFKQIAAEENTLDFGLSTQMIDGKSGIGVIGKIDYVIISDIIVARSEPEIPINIEIKNVKVLFNDGSIKSVDSDNNVDEINIILDQTTDTKETSQTDDFGVSPNPAADHVVLDLPTSFDLSLNTTVRMFNSAGKLVSSRDLEGAEEPVLTLENIDAGVYLLEVVNGYTQLKTTFVKF